MDDGIRLGRIAGVDVAADWSVAVTFVLITIYLATAVFPTWHPQWTPLISWLTGFGCAVLFVGSVLIHELTHAILGQHAGARTRGVMLFPFGGVPYMDLELASPSVELRTAMAAPVVNLLLGMVCFWLASAAETPGSAILQSLGWMNVALCAIHLLPGLPLDCGRVLRAIVWSAVGDHRLATRIASRTGQAFGWVAILCGIALCFGMSVPVLDEDISAGPWLILAGWFLNRAALVSLRSVLITDVYRGLAALDKLTDVATSDLMRDVRTRLHPLVELRDLHDRGELFAEQPLLPIEVDGIFLGWVRCEDLTCLEYDALGRLRLGELMIPLKYLPTVRPEQTVAEAVAMMNQCRVDYIAVVRQRRLLGIVSREDVVTWACGEAQAVAIERARSGRPGSRS